MTGAIASVLFHLPIMRQIYYWMGCIPAGEICGGGWAGGGGGV
jgi:hypothetical protein